MGLRTELELRNLHYKILDRKSNRKRIDELKGFRDTPLEKDEDEVVFITCPTCGGERENIMGEVCEHCWGTGEVRE